MTSKYPTFDINRKPPPPPGRPTYEQRAKAMQYETRNHWIYDPNGKKVHCKILIPKKQAPEDEVSVPTSIVVKDAPEIHYEKGFKPNNDFKADMDDEDASIESADNSCCSYNLDYHNDHVFRQGFEDPVETADGEAPAPFLQRQHAFAYSRSTSIDSIEDIVVVDDSQRECDHHDQAATKPSRPRFMRGFLGFLKQGAKK